MKYHKYHYYIKMLILESRNIIPLMKPFYNFMFIQVL